jgi:rod shape-determining protein MreD
MIQPTHSSRRILLPARAWFIYFSLLVAGVLNLIPLGRLPGVPDWRWMSPTPA